VTGDPVWARAGDRFLINLALDAPILHTANQGEQKRNIIKKSLKGRPRDGAFGRTAGDEELDLTISVVVIRVWT
jgi:hypothetical protein